MCVISDCNINFYCRRRRRRRRFPLACVVVSPLSRFSQILPVVSKLLLTQIRAAIIGNALEIDHMLWCFILYKIVIFVTFLTSNVYINI